MKVIKGRSRYKIQMRPNEESRGRKQRGITIQHESKAK